MTPRSINTTTRPIAAVLTKLIGLVIALFSATTSYGYDSEQAFDNHIVHYTVLNSSFISPEVAKVYDIVRSKQRGLVTIALKHKDTPDNQGGEKAFVKGVVTNLLSQQKTLNFIEIREHKAIYYIAEFRFTNEESLSFTIDVKSAPNAKPYTIKFRRILYEQ